MGAFLGSIHVHTDDRDAVRAALVGVASAKGCLFLLAPTLRGWTTAYPSANGQDASVSKAIARKLPYDIVHVLVHDDDVFAYFVYRSGKLLDEFDSKPDYFGPASARKKAKVAGKPDRFADLLKEPAALPEMRRLLDEDPLFASASLGRFAELLDLPNAATSYEYLQEGETDGIEAFDRFVRVPETSEHERHHDRTQTAFDSIRDKLRHERILLAELHAPPGDRSGHLPIWCSFSLGGLLVGWSPGDPVAPQGRTPVLRWTPPWNEPPTPFGIHIDDEACVMATSPSGRFLAVGLASEQRTAQLWDISARALVAEIPAPPHVRSLAFSADEHSLAIRSVDRVVVVETEPGHPAVTVELPGDHPVTFHPTEQYLLAGYANGLAILELPSGRVVNDLCIGGVYDISGLREGALAGLRAALGTFPKQLEKLQREMSALPPEVWARAEKQCRQLQASIESGQLPGLRWTRQTVEHVCRIAVSPDGSTLFLATHGGARCYSWRAVLEARECTPPPLCAADAELIEIEWSSESSTPQSHTYDLVYDSVARLLLFGGLEGKVRALDLSTGRSFDLAPRLAFGAVAALALSPNRSCLYTLTAFPFGGRSAEEAPVLRVWDYERLRASAMLNG